MKSRRTMLAGALALTVAGCDSSTTVDTGNPSPAEPGGGSAPTGSGAGGRSGGGAGGSVPDIGFRADAGAAAGRGGSGAPAGMTPTVGMNCGIQSHDLQRVPPEVMLVLDRSGSMTEMARGGGTKWQAVTGALDHVLMRTQGGVFWGLKMYPSDMRCGVDDNINVQNTLNAHMSMAGAMSMAPPVQNGGATPTALAVGKAVAYMKTRTTPNPKYLLLATDGQPNCRGGNAQLDDDNGAVAAVGQAAMQGLPTFVIGIAINNDAQDTLNRMAVAGTRPRADPRTRYYPAANRDELVQALETITGQIASCTFPLNPPPPSPDAVAVEVDAARVPRDATRMNGWEYDAGGRSITLYGQWCERVKARAAAGVRILYGCPGMVIP